MQVPPQDALKSSIGLAPLFAHQLRRLLTSYFSFFLAYSNYSQKNLESNAKSLNRNPKCMLRSIQPNLIAGFFYLIELVMYSLTRSVHHAFGHVQTLINKRLVRLHTHHIEITSFRQIKTTQ